MTLIVKVRSRYDYDSAEFDVPLNFEVKKDSKGRILNPEVVSMTKQEFGKEADINFIIARAQATGFLTDPNQSNGRGPMFGDFTTVPDFLTQQNRLATFRSDFDRLTPELKARFEHNPEKVIEFLADSANAEEAIKLGLRRKPKSAPAPVEPVLPPVPPAPVVPPVVELLKLAS